MRGFLDHCLTGTNYATGEKGTPIDFVSFHAKGAPQNVAGHVRMGISNQLRTIDEGFRMIARYPELKQKPIIIGESDPEGCAACQGPQLAYRNGTMYSSYTAASFARKLDLADRSGVNFEGALTWAFEFEGHPYFAGFRSLATNGVDKPVLNVFRMYSKMAGKRIDATSDGAVALDEMLRRGVRAKPDVSALASLDGKRLCVMVWHYHDDDLPGPDAQVSIDVTGLPTEEKSAKLTHYRIDEKHSNAFALWKDLGSPQMPTPEQYAQLETRGRLQALGAAGEIAVNAGAAKIEFPLARAGVSLLEIVLK
jgi:xylan 1,4-beta-xylosidase